MIFCGKRKKEAEYPQGLPATYDKYLHIDCIFICLYRNFCIFLRPPTNKYSKMSIKSQRLEAIRQIIAHDGAKNQEEVLNLVHARGFSATQATLSRDFKEIGVIKLHDPDKGYVYKLAGGAHSFVLPSAHHITEGIRSIEFSNSFAVLKTQPGFAGAVASIIDDNAVDEIVGSIAGDDTVLLVIREGYTREQVLDSVSRFISGIQFKVK